MRRSPHAARVQRSDGCQHPRSADRVLTLTHCSHILVSMRPGDTPVLIPNTTVKTRTADGTMPETAWESRRAPDSRGYSSAGRAPALQAGGQGFESPYLHCGKRDCRRRLPRLYLENRISNDKHQRLQLTKQTKTSEAMTSETESWKRKRTKFFEGQE